MNENKPLQRRQGVFHATRCGKESKQVVQATRGSAHENDFTVKRTKAQIECFPALDEKVLEDKRKIEDYDKLFRSSWTTGPSTRKPATSNRLSSFQNELVETAAKSKLTSGYFGERAPIFSNTRSAITRPCHCSGLRGQYQVAVGDRARHRLNRLASLPHLSKLRPPSSRVTRCPGICETSSSIISNFKCIRSRASELWCSRSHDCIVQNTRVASVWAARRKLVKLFKKPKSKFYWYDFTVRGRRCRGSTHETKSVRALPEPISKSKART